MELVIKHIIWICFSLTEGFTGSNCGTLINNCVSSNICLNGGTCVNQVNSYTCTCAIGFTGAKCDSNVGLNIPATAASSVNNNTGVCFKYYMFLVSILYKIFK